MAMTPLRDQVRAAPMTWKDWLGAAGTITSLAALLVFGGRVLEQGENTRTEVSKLTAELVLLRKDLASMQLQLTVQDGKDRLHDEQIQVLRRDLDARRRREP